MPSRTQTVANLVLEHSECAAVFQRHRIDFCCRGHISIEEAAKERGLAAETLLAELAQAVAARCEERRPDPRELSTAQLVAHIVSTHHEYLRHALPFVGGLARKVGRVHGGENPNLRLLDEAVAELENALLPHLDEEEQTLFPLLTSGYVEREEAAKLLEEMHSEHLLVAKLLERIRAASDDFSLPEWACNSYRTLFAELRQLESDTFTHVHLENHVLSPRFAA